MRVPILLQQHDVEDSIPTEVEMAESIIGLKEGNAGVPISMRVEDLKGWIQKATRKKYQLRRRWEISVIFIQQNLGTGPHQRSAHEIQWYSY